MKFQASSSKSLEQCLELLGQDDAKVISIKHDLNDSSTSLILESDVFMANSEGLKVEQIDSSTEINELPPLNHPVSVDYITTVISNSLSVLTLKKIVQCTQKNAKIIAIDPICHRDSSENLAAKTSLRLILSSTDYSNLKSEIEFLSLEHTFDYSIQELNDYSTQRKIAFFDMDSTLIQAEVINELAAEANIESQVAEITESAMRGEIEFNESFAKRLALLQGLDESVLNNVYSRVQRTKGVEYLASKLKAEGMRLVILSGGFHFFADQLASSLGFDEVRANILEIVDGKVTGTPNKPIVNGKLKASYVSEICESNNIPLSESVCVGDGANDLEMIGLSGFGVAFHAKPLVREKAPYKISYTGIDSLLDMLGIQE